jgi:hypothetical protein
VETERDLIASENLSAGSCLLLPRIYVLFSFFMRSSVIYCTSTAWI